MFESRNESTASVRRSFSVDLSSTRRSWLSMVLGSTCASGFSRLALLHDNISVRFLNVRALNHLSFRRRHSMSNLPVDWLGRWQENNLSMNARASTWQQVAHISIDILNRAYLRLRLGLHIHWWRWWWWWSVHVGQELWHRVRRRHEWIVEW